MAKQLTNNEVVGFIVGTYLGIMGMFIIHALLG